MQQNIAIFDNIAIIRIIPKHVQTTYTLFTYQLFSFRLARPIICVITRNRNNVRMYILYKIVYAKIRVVCMLPRCAMQVHTYIRMYVLCTCVE